MPTPASTLQRLTSWISACVASVCPTIHTVTVGYINEVATGQSDYDVLLLTPPKYSRDSRNNSYKDYDIHYFLIRQDKGADGQNQMTPDERVAAWGALENINDALVNAMATDPSTCQVLTNVTSDPNSGGGDQLLPDAVIWQEVTFTLRVNACL